MGQDVMIPAHDGGYFACYVAIPALRPAPGLVLIQYICGVNRVMRTLADEFAAQGMLVAVPDLFWRQQPGVALNDDPSRPDPEDHERSLALNAGFDDENGIADLCSTLAWLRARPECSGRAGVLGYCLGGRLAFLMMLHIAGRDELCPPQAQREIMAALAANPAACVHVYEQAGHAFALPGGSNFNSAAAEAADWRSLQFLRQMLLPSSAKQPAAAAQNR
jgi:carboxymethylenebutenolidase